MAKVCIEKVGKMFYHFYPTIVTVVTVHSGGRDNAMPAAWNSALSFDPPLYGVAISPKRHTYQMILDAKEFALNFLPYEAAEAMAQTGGCSGREVDKFQRFQLAKESPLKIKSPILKDAYASYECRLVDHHTYGDHEWFVGEVVAVHYLKDGFDEKGIIRLDRLNPALYMGSDLYITAARESKRHLDREVYGRGA
ncbi:MAG: flavin reductase family protein [candidate division NC10 bacterium]|nr:flavin reductase family protein [candidate division NC10 bacterium]